MELDFLVDGEYTKWRNQLFLNVLVLIVTPDDDEIWIEFVDASTRFAKSFLQFRFVLFGDGQTLVVAPLLSHLRRPVLRVFEMLRREIALQVLAEVVVSHLFDCRVKPNVRAADSENLTHHVPPDFFIAMLGAHAVFG